MENFTAHVREIDETIEIQTVLAHSEGAEKLAEKYTKKLEIGNMVKLALKIHDFGKLCKDFDDYINGRNNLRRGMIDHCYAGAKYLSELAYETNDQQIIETAEFIARIVLSHHGLHDWVDENGKNYFQNRIKKSERYEEIKKNIKDIISDEEILKILFEAKNEYVCIRGKIRSMSSGSKQKKLFAFYMGLFERMTLSILVDADRTDTTEFQYNSDIEHTFSEDIWNQSCEKMEERIIGFEKHTDKISRQRTSISDRCMQFANHEVGICRLVVPTGGGKTLSSLRFALNYCKKYGKEHIFYIAPYQSILEQNSDVWSEIVGKENFLEHHSDILAAFENEEEIEDYELRSEKWDVPVIATTMVQFLNTFFLDRMDSVRRMHRLCNSVIIIDEVQSIPVKCISLFNLAMNYMKEIGQSCIVLCSATQPTFEKVLYSLKFDENESMTGDYTKDFLEFKRNEIISQVTYKGYSYEQAADFCVEKFEEEGNVLFVVNTKTSAWRIYKEIEKKELKDVKIVHLSTNMCPEHRRRCINGLKLELDRKQKIICITTQLIEAGVDISFPCVIRSLVGLSNVVQAAGRCNRGGEYNRCCNVYLINLNEESVSNLKEIQIGQKVTRAILDNKNYLNMQAVETLSDYFKKYYQEMENELSFNVEDVEVKTDLLELLSLNAGRYSSGSKNDKKFYNKQAFKTAGKLFKVIEDYTLPVIVPYNDLAKEVVTCLRSNQYSYLWNQKLREAQKYVVGINQWTEKRLQKEGAIELLQSGVYVLDERYYDCDCGVQIEGKSMELLMY